MSADVDTARARTEGCRVVSVEFLYNRFHNAIRSVADPRWRDFRWRAVAAIMDCVTAAYV